MKNKIKAKLKWLYCTLIYKLRKHLLPKHYRFEYEFYEKIRSRSYSDTSYMELKLRAITHALDKTLVFKKINEKKAICSLIREMTKQVKNDPGHDAATVGWSQMVLDEYEKRSNGTSGLSENFESLDIATSELLKDILTSRRSIRSFKANPISKELVYQILNAGLWAPTGCNRQTMEYLLLEDKEDIRFCQKMAGEGYAFPAQAPLTVVILIDPRGYALPVQRHMAFLEGGAATQNILLMAHSLGIGSCWLFWDNSTVNYSKFMKRFSLNPWLLPVAMICLGYPDKIPNFRPERKNLTKCIHFSKSGLQRTSNDTAKLARRNLDDIACHC